MQISETESARLNTPVFNRSKKKISELRFFFCGFAKGYYITDVKRQTPQTKPDQTKMTDSYLALLQAMESDLFDSFYLPCDGPSDPQTFYFKARLAIYVHCMEYHSGQSSDKYKILCSLKRLGFDLGQWEYAREEETCIMMHQTLNEKYGNK